MVKKAVIIISLVEQSIERTNEEIEKEILNAISEESTKIPWLKEVEKVKVTKE
jgi:hypothetical protein